jgi:hypothetical protein
MSTAPHDDVRGRWLFSATTHAVPASRRFNRGIATIEAVSVVAVTLLMVAVAMSAYHTYSVRREVRKTLVDVIPLQRLVTDFFASTGTPPTSESDLPAFEPVDRPFIDGVTIERGRIEIRFSDDAAESLRGKSLPISPFETMDGDVFWLCGDRRAEIGLYPLGLFGGTPGPEVVVTTIDHRYLPPECL